MGIRITSKSKATATIKLYNQITSYLFEQEFGELRGNDKARQALANAKSALAEIIG